MDNFRYIYYKNFGIYSEALSSTDIIFIPVFVFVSKFCRRRQALDGKPCWFRILSSLVQYWYNIPDWNLRPELTRERKDEDEDEDEDNDDDDDIRKGPWAP